MAAKVIVSELLFDFRPDGPTDYCFLEVTVIRCSFTFGPDKASVK